MFKTYNTREEAVTDLISNGYKEVAKYIFTKPGFEAMLHSTHNSAKIQVSIVTVK